MSAEQPAGGRQPTFSYCIIIIIIVAAIAAAMVVRGPLGPSREKGRQVSCMSNEKQLALAVLLYAQDSDGRLPGPARWATAALPYLKVPPSVGPGAVYTCPSQDRPPQLPGTPWKRGQGLSYALSLGLPSGKVSDCEGPGEIPLLFDCDLVPGALAYQMDRRHRDGANCAFLDGHASWVYREQIEKMEDGKPIR
jgi:prepilin-type processing-associated H-X9-DG protein